MHIIREESDFQAFERVMVEAHLRQTIRILSYCVLSNHWHFVAWPEEDGQLTDSFRRLAHIDAILGASRTGRGATGTFILPLPTEKRLVAQYASSPPA
jgi:hypothetical protein